MRNIISCDHWKMSIEEQTKKVCVLWSKLAVESQTVEQLCSLEDKILEEASNIVTEVIGWFFHCEFADNTDKENDLRYLCIGYEKDDRWDIFVRLAKYESKYSSSDDELNGRERIPVMIPVAIKDSDNELFISLEQLIPDEYVNPSIL